MSERETRTLRARIHLHEALLTLLVFLNLYQILPFTGDRGGLVMLIAFGVLTFYLFGRMAASLYGERIRRLVGIKRGTQ